MSADLLARARAATTREEECAVINTALRRDALERLSPRVSSRDLIALQNIVHDVRFGRAPAAVLLGVVAALKPDDLRFVCGESTHAPPGKQAWGEMMQPYSLAPVVGEGEAPTTALALLIAILEADNAEA